MQPRKHEAPRRLRRVSRCRRNTPAKRLRFEALEGRQLLSINPGAAGLDSDPQPQSDLPDLVDTDAWFGENFGYVSTTTPAPGDSFALETYPYNLGPGLAGSYTVRYRISTDTQYDLGDTLLGDVSSPGLGPDETDFAALTTTFPSVPGGTYYVVFRVDALDTVVETDEGNNLGHIATLLTVPDGILADRFEVNDSFATATIFGVLGHREELDLTLHSSTDKDYFRFTAAASGTADVSLAFSHALGDVDFAVYNAAFSQLASSTGGGDTEAASFAVTVGQTYYVVVEGYEGDTSPQYDLLIDAPSPPPDRFEPNNAFGTAAFLGVIGHIEESNLNIHSAFNDDYFRFTAANTGQASLDLLFSHAAGDLDVAIFDADMNLIGSSALPADNEHIDFDVTAGATYYIQVLGFSGAVNANYELIVDGPAEIQGVKWSDLNNNGQRDPGEPGVADWTIYLDLDADGQWDAGEPTTVTDETGHYAFGNLAAGNYVVGEFSQPGWTQTWPAGVQKPDLAGTAFDVTNEPLTAGDIVPITFSVKNIGDLIASGFDIGFYLSPDPIITPSGLGADYLLGFLANPASLLPDASYSSLTSPTLPGADHPFWSGDGDYYIGLYVDDQFESSESNEQNNSGRGLGIDLDLVHISDTLSLASAGQAIAAVESQATFARLPRDPALAIAAGPEGLPLTTTDSTAPVYIDEAPEFPGGFEINDAQSNPLINLTTFRSDLRFAGIDGSGFSSVIIDTGIDLNHPYFGPDADSNGVADRIVYSYDFSGPNDPDASDFNGHGSNVASIVASQNATHGGMAPGTNIIALKVFTDAGAGNFGDTEQALQWVVANAALYNIASVNMSLGDTQNHTFAQSLYGLGDELAALAAMNVLVVSSSGNSFFTFGSAQGVGYPGADVNSLAVGAVWDANNGGPITFSSGAIDNTTGADRITSFSQRHATLLDIFAPGAFITGANATGGTASYAGTSQASPHIAGIATLAQQLAVQTLGRRLTLSEFRNLLHDTGVSIFDGDDENDNVVNTNLSYRRVNVLALGEAILAMGGTPPTSRQVILATGETSLGNDFGNHATSSSVVGRRLFYNQSGTAAPLRYDGNNAAINANDDLAIATNKVAYLPGSGAATFANVSNYTKGINGIMVDIAGAHGTITAADFIFRVGNNNTPNSWAAAPAPSSISVRAGAGTSGSDRVVLTWANGAISKKWLEVIVLANANTGLPQKAGYPAGQGDVFFFGNAVANSGSGDTATQATVNTTDELTARNNPASLASNIPITNLFDYNRDGQVNTTDALASRNNPTNAGNVVRYISVGSPPSTPDVLLASEVSYTAIATGLALPSSENQATDGRPYFVLLPTDRETARGTSLDRPSELLLDRQAPTARRAAAAIDRAIAQWADVDLGFDRVLYELDQA